MIKIESLKAGDVLYDVHSERAGNTTMRQEGCWECFVRAVDSAGKWVEISWNGNPARRFAAVPKGYKRAPKEWIRSELFSERRCHFCMKSETVGHAPDCEHPRAIAARKKAAKAQKEQPCEPFGSWYIFDPNGTPLCRVEPVGSHAKAGPLSGIYLVDFEATRKRAEHIAEALRHYQQSQEGDRVP